LICFNDDETDQIIRRFHIYATLLAISAAFLGATFLVYVFIVTPLNLHGKTLVCHVLSLFIAYTLLSIVQFQTEVMYTLCKCIGESKYGLSPPHKSDFFSSQTQVISCFSDFCQVLDDKRLLIRIRPARQRAKKLPLRPSGNKFRPGNPIDSIGFIYRPPFTIK
jgi:hypothetical protein